MIQATFAKIFHPTRNPKPVHSVKESAVKPKLAEIEFFAVMTDLWTSRATNPYLSSTVHFIDRSWELLSLCMYSKMLYSF